MGDINAIRYKLKKVGYSLFELDEKLNIEELIIDLIKSNDLRYIKSIPFIIFQYPTLDIFALSKLAQANSLKREVNLMIYTSYLIFKKQKLSRTLTFRYLKGYSTKKEIDIFNKLKEGIIDKQLKCLSFRISGTFLDEAYSDFVMHKTALELNKKDRLSEQISKSMEMEIQFALSRLFKKKQKEIIDKILNEDKLTKTEYEYYIRVIKKKLDAITQLNEMAAAAFRKKIKRV